MLDKRHCKGCRNNFYNIERDGCWLRRDKEEDELVKRYRIHMDSPANIIENYIEMICPPCYNLAGYSDPLCSIIVDKIPHYAIHREENVTEN